MTAAPPEGRAVEMRAGEDIVEGGRDHWGQVVGEELVECLGQAGRLVGLQVGHVRNAHLRE